jgi:tetratricopeptide (TPR) repeat protein
MNLDKLKEAARRHELRDEWRKAIEIYQKALLDLAQAGEPADPSLHNRVGDLELKAGGIAEAIRAYEQAADAYADQGFFNNAIALCGKILRLTPGRTATFLRLAELHARKNVLPEIRRNLTEYVGRMAQSGHLQPLETALRGFSDRFAHTGELRALMADVLSSAGTGAEVQPHLAEMAGRLGLAETTPQGGQHGGRVPVQPPATGGLVFLDTGIDLPGIALGGPPPEPFEADAFTAGPLPEADSLDADLVDPGRAGTDAIPSLPFVEPTMLSPGPGTMAPGSTIAGLQPTAYDLSPHEAVPAPPLLYVPVPELVEIPGLEPLPEFEPGAVEAPPLELLSIESDDEALPLLGVASSLAASPPGGFSEPLFDQLDLEEMVAKARYTGEGPDLRAASATDLREHGVALVREERWQAAYDVLSELIRRTPGAVALHQERVEIAFRAGDRPQLVGAYLSLANALEQAGARENARLVFGRVLEHDPTNPEAAAAVAALSGAGLTAADDPPAMPGAEPGNEFVDLGALILDPEPERDSRMRVDQGEPEKEEDVDFRETLEQFKQGIAENIDLTDFQAHYDLGIAFKEMGLLDEAIAQFQKALRAPEGRLRSSEALGVAFFEKGRTGIAEQVLARAIEALPGADDEKIGLIYWLGRAHEAQGRAEDALRWYERALAVDITFLDLGERIQRLTVERVQ